MTNTLASHGHTLESKLVRMFGSQTLPPHVIRDVLLEREHQLQRTDEAKTCHLGEACALGLEELRFSDEQLGLPLKR